jgi:LPS O-antigen subunit length determinant protein (WzzB/FepE family)
LYDPASGRYRYDFSLFIGMAIGAMIILTGISFLAREAWRARALKANKTT